MTCPACGGHSHKAIAPNYYECANLIDVPTTVLQPSRAMPPYLGVMEPVTFMTQRVCGTRYQIGGGMVTPKCNCSTFSIGSCSACDKPVCGDHSILLGERRLCSNCYREDRERAAEAAAVKAAAVRARQTAKRETQRSREAVVQAKEDRELKAHSQVLAKRRVGYGSAREIAARIQRLQQGRGRSRFNLYGQHDNLLLLLFIAVVMGPPLGIASYITSPSYPLLDREDSWLVFVAVLVVEIAAGVLVAMVSKWRRNAELARLRQMLVCGDPECRRCQYLN